MKHTYQQPAISVITPLTEYHLLEGSRELTGETDTTSSTTGGHADSNTTDIWETDEENNDVIWGKH